jgi:hypothetical protein
VLELVVVPKLPTEKAKPLSMVLCKSALPSPKVTLVPRPFTAMPAPAAAVVVVVVVVVGVVGVVIVVLVAYSGDSVVMKVATAARTSSTALAYRGFAAAWATRSHTAASDGHGISCTADTSGMQRSVADWPKSTAGEDCRRTA